MRSFTTALVLVMLCGAIGSAVYLRNNLRAREAADLLARQQQRTDIRITIPEGKRREEIALRLEELGITSYDAFMTASKDLEGKLFPDTYRFFANTPAEDVARSMNNTFKRRVADLDVTKPPAPLASINDIVNLAAIVEREAITDEERPQIAEVYLNRLRIGMKLDADPTVQYGKATNALEQGGNAKDVTMWPVLTRADYQAVISPYNTYRSAGLPPAAIANPGMKSIQAVLQPATHDYFYFFHRENQLYLSRTLTEHEAKLQGR
jgi:UPF0755 protein